MYWKQENFYFVDDDDVDNSWAIEEREQKFEKKKKKWRIWEI